MMSFAVILALLATCLLGETPARAEEPPLPGHLAILMGMGQSFPGWGATTERVKTVDLTLRYAGLINRRLGPEALKAREQLWIEVPFFWVHEPDDAPIYSINFLFCCIFERFDACQPYLTVGGGPVYASADIPGMGSRLCGNYQAGLGIRLPFAGCALHLESRYHHISNLHMADPNVPINSLRGLIGVSRNF